MSDETTTEERPATGTLISTANEPGLRETVKEFASDYVAKSGDPVVGRLLADIQARDDELAKLERSNPAPGVIAERLEELNAEIMLAHYQRVEQSIAEAEAEAAEIAREVDYESVRRPEETTLRERRTATAIEAMTTAELEEAADAFIGGDSDLGLYALNLLGRELKRAGSDRHEALRKAMRDRHASEQWRRTETGRTLGQRLDFLKSMRGGHVAWALDGDPNAIQSIRLKRLLSR